MNPDLKRYVWLLMMIYANATHAQLNKEVAVEPGVSHSLALFRKSVITDIQYTLNFHIPAVKDEHIDAHEIIEFNLKSAGQTLQLDFRQPVENLKHIEVNGSPVIAQVQLEHILIKKEDLKKGRNRIEIEFIAGESSLNRNDEYLYALFVPDRARTVFPCFDQPDLKARFLLMLQIPRGWAALTNGMKKDSSEKNGEVTWHFANSDKISTYLFSFTAGRYTDIVKNKEGRDMEFLFRETDTSKIRFSVDSAFNIHNDALRFLENYSAIPYPFQKIGFVAIPDFQFGGMEHPGEVQYRASGIFLDDGATKNMKLSRIGLISHETAHMWFGDLVTMRWFDDVWMKEVFANFMADKVVRNLMGSETFDLNFLQDHFPSAYSIDRTEGSHPIRQKLDNLKDAGSLYGNIIYHKAPVMMKQLELLMGETAFKTGLRKYLKQYSYANADWPELIDILSQYTKADLHKWNNVWVNEPGRPVFNYTIAYTNNQVSRFVITQQSEYGKAKVWPQHFNVSFIYPDSIKTFPVEMKEASVELIKASGCDKPSCILFNSDGLGYGLFPADTAMQQHVFELKSPLFRASAYITFFENMLSARAVEPQTLLELFEEGISKEKNELNLRLMTQYLGNIYWHFLSSSGRQHNAQKLESVVCQAMEQQSQENNKKILFKLFQDIYRSDTAIAMMQSIWKQQQPPVGVKLTEEDYTDLALSIALRSDTITHVLDEQLERIKNPDRQKRLAFMLPALSANVADRDNFFNGLKQRNNRTREAWVISALYYLHHPLRQGTSIKYLPQSLEMLEEIKTTGDIFFPQSWLGAIFGNYQSAEAAQMVRTFLQSHENYDPQLRNKILQAADNLFRASKIVRQE